MPEGALPTDLFHWVLALIPIIVIVVLLVGLNWQGVQVATIGMFSVALIAFLFFRTGPFELAVSAGKGVWDAVFILWVVWPALLMYRVIDAAGGFDALRVGMTRFSRSDIFLVMAFAWGFASFLQGIAGFGVPIAIVAPILVAIGVRPVYAVALPLIGHAWGKMFGTLSVGWLATLQVVEVQDPTATAFQAALLIWIINLLGGLGIAWLYGRMPAVRFALPLILVISALQGGVQAGLMFWNPVLANFIAASVALAAFVPLARWRYAEPATTIPEQLVMEEGHEPGRADEIEGPEPVMGIGLAVLPYVLLTVLAVGALAFPPVERMLGQFNFGFPFPSIETGYGVARPMEAPYSPIAPLTHPGTFLLITSIVTWLVYRSRGIYQKWAERANPGGILSGLAREAVPASVTIVGFLVMSRIMDHSGQTEILALGIAAVAPAIVYAFLSNWIGLLGAFITSSSTSSQILFTPLQSSVAASAGLPQATIIGAQSAGGCIGNTIAPANIVLGASTTGIIGKEGPILRATLPWTLITAVILGIATVLLVVLQ